MSEKTINLMTFKLKQVKAKLYYLSFPAETKRKLIELERETSPYWNSQNMSLPFEGTLTKMLENYLNVTAISKVNSASSDTHWITSAEKISPVLVCRIVQIWIRTFYIEESNTGYSKKRTESVKRKAQEILEALSPEDFAVSEEEAPRELIDTKGCVANSLAYKLVRCMVTEAMNGERLHLGRGEYTFYRCAENQLMSVPEEIDLHKGKYYSSIVVTFTLQTIPSRDEVYLCVEMSRRRWVGQGNKSFSLRNKTCYIREEKRFVPIRAIRDKKRKKSYWRADDVLWYKKRFALEDLPEYETVLKDPQGPGNSAIYIPYDQTFMYTGYAKTGISMTDRKDMIAECKRCLEAYIDVEPITAIKIDGKGSKPSRTYFDEEFHRNPEGTFPDAVKSAVGDTPLSVYVWRHIGNVDEEKAAKLLLTVLKDQFADMDVDISLHDLKELADPLCVDPGNEKGKSARGVRIEQIRKRIAKTENHKSLSFIFLNGKDDYNDEQDPKNAMRMGFHLSGHLTQFLVAKDVLEQEESRLSAIEKEKEKQESDNRTRMENGEDAVWKEISVGPNRNIQGAVLDGYRQLGILPDYRGRKDVKGKICMGIQGIPMMKLIGGKMVDTFQRH